jgi:hypothetical protein
MYSAAVEETLAYGEVSKGQISLLDRLRDSLNVSKEDADRMERSLNFNRNLVQA